MRNNLKPPSEWINPNKPREKKIFKLGGGILIVSLILLAGTAGYLVINGKQSYPPASTEQPETEEISSEVQSKPQEQESLHETVPVQSEDIQQEEKKHRQDASESDASESDTSEPETLKQDGSEQDGSEQDGSEQDGSALNKSLNYELGPCVLSEDESYFITYMAGYCWQKINNGEGSFSANEEELLGQDIEYDQDGVSCQPVHSEMTSEGLLCEGIIMRQIENGNHSLYTSPHYFSVLMTLEGEIIVTYEQFQNCAAKATATSELTDSHGTYQDDYAIDGNNKTAWVIGAEERTGESITLTLDKERTVYGVLILNGYWKSESTYNNNGVVTEFDIYAKDEWKTFAYGFKRNYTDNISGQQVYDVAGIFYDSMTADQVTVKISGVEDGEKYGDICISEIMILAR